MGAPSSSAQLASSEPAVRAFLTRRLRSGEVEDATQTVMQRALERLDAFESADRPRAWLIGVARNVAFEVMRARARAPVSSSDVEILDLEPSPTAEERLGALELNNLLYRALDGLRADDQLALMMTYVDGLRGPEAAELLGVSFPAFRQRLSRARKQAEQRILELAATPSRVDPAALRAWQRLLESRAPDRIADERRSRAAPAPTLVDRSSRR